jgi:4-amino-4-deoxy-L-arabinose transferase-like glycosyltransferase
MRFQAAALVLAVLLLRLPFLNQPVQGDDYYYLAGAMRAQIDPAHPTHGRYVFLGEWVDMRGHPHPPLNMWFLGALLAAMGDIREAPFHAAYIVFSLAAVLGVWWLARRFGAPPVWAALMFAATPAFLVNGNSLEADVPFVALWIVSAALYVQAVDTRSGRTLAAAASVMALAAMAAYQAVVLAPVLAGYLWWKRRDWVAGWAALAAPAAALAAWQFFERVTSGAAPAGVLAEYFTAYGFQAVSSKLRNAVALTVHAGWLVFPLLALAAFRRSPRAVWLAAIGGAAAGAALLDRHPLFWVSFGAGLVVVLGSLHALTRSADGERRFLAWWIAVFFGAALALFFAGSARYLLPMAAPLALLVTRELADRRRWLAAGFALQMGIWLGAAVMNYQHWDAYRRFVEQLRPEFAGRRVWVNAEWGLRFYAEAEGALPLLRSQAVEPGQIVVASRIAYPATFTTGGGRLAPIARRLIRPLPPVRLIGLGVRSAYSTVTLGYRPFDLGWGPVDEISAELVVEQKPVHEWLPMGAPEAESQIISGIYQLEGGRWRWMGERAAILLKAPAAPSVVEAELYVPEGAAARRVELRIDGRAVAEARLGKPGSHRLRSPGPVAVAAETATLEIVVDRTFSPPGDHRRLGVILMGAGFRKAG